MNLSVRTPVHIQSPNGDNILNNDSYKRDQVVLDSLDANMHEAPKYGICADTFYALKEEFLRVMQERDEAIAKLQALQEGKPHEM